MLTTLLVKWVKTFPNMELTTALITPVVVGAITTHQTRQELTDLIGMREVALIQEMGLIQKPLPQPLAHHQHHPVDQKDLRAPLLPPLRHHLSLLLLPLVAGLNPKRTSRALDLEMQSVV